MATTKIPHVSPADAATNAAKDLTAALAHPPNTALFAAIGDKQLNAIKQLEELFECITTPGTTATKCNTGDLRVHAPKTPDNTETLPRVQVKILEQKPQHIKT
eukprot:14353274-Ditylum_brightwellii.AAC.1